MKANQNKNGKTQTAKTTEVLKAKTGKIESLSFIDGVQLYRLFGSVDWEAYVNGQKELTIAAQRKGKYAISETAKTGNDIALWLGEQGACAMVGKLGTVKVDGKTVNFIQSGLFCLALDGFKALSTHIGGKGIEKRFTGKGKVNGKAVRTFVNMEAKNNMVGFYLENGKIIRNQFKTIATKAHTDKWCRGLQILA